MWCSMLPPVDPAVDHFHVLDTRPGLERVRQQGRDENQPHKNDSPEKCEFVTSCCSSDLIYITHWIVLLFILLGKCWWILLSYLVWAIPTHEWAGLFLEWQNPRNKGRWQPHLWLNTFLYFKNGNAKSGHVVILHQLFIFMQIPI